MELMSMLLFYAFLVQLPLALGVQSESNSDIQVKFNSSNLDANSTVKSDTDYRALKNHSSLKVNKIIEPHSYLSDYRCRYCTGCMEKAVNASKNTTTHSYKNIYPEFHQLQSGANNKHFKRSVRFNSSNTETMTEGSLNSMRITKYKTADEKVYAIKINEMNQISEPNNGKSTCKVYSVKKAYPCESEESNLILMNRKVNKKRISKQKNISTSTEKSIPSVISPGFKKRQVRVENSHVPETFMSSIEEQY